MRKPLANIFCLTFFFRNPCPCGAFQFIKEYNDGLPQEPLHTNIKQKKQPFRIALFIDFEKAYIVKEGNNNISCSKTITSTLLQSGTNHENSFT